MSAANAEARDAADRNERQENLHPRSWHNPDGGGCWNLVVIGAGPAGLVAARIAAALGARVALIERGLLGGDCLNVGCVPSKAIIRASRVIADLRDGLRYGLAASDDIDTEFALTMRRMRHIRARISRVDAAVGLKRAGIDVFFGQARFLDASTLDVDGQRLHFRKAIVATGGRQQPPDIEGLAAAGYLTVENVFELERLPKRLMVIGGGPLGTELGQAFCRLGTNVILVHDEAKFLPREERDAAQLLSDSMARDGVEIHLDTRAVRASGQGERTQVELLNSGNRQTLTVDDVLTGIGRVPNVAELDLGRAGVDFDAITGIDVDDHLRTTNSRIFAAGDVCCEHRFTHVADASARLAVENALFVARKRMSRLTIPWCTYTDPEIAHVGLQVEDANRLGVPLKTYTVLMHEVDRAITDSEEQGFVKIHVREGSDCILGSTIVARHAGEMINEVTLAMQRGIGLVGLSSVIHCYPTQAGAIKMAADACAADRLTPFLHRLRSRWLQWQRRRRFW